MINLKRTQYRITVILLLYLNMMKISEIQNEIKASISSCYASLGFNVSKSPTFYYCKESLLKIASIDFLSKTNAHYFNSNSASFTLGIGIYFNFENQNIFPKEYECQVHGVLLRDFRQKNPMDLSGFPLFHPERKRRDIWWVEKDGKSLDKLLINASRIINKNAIKWLDKFSDPDYLVRYLKIGKEIDSWKGGPFGFGAIGSPFRQDAINKLEKWMTRTS